MVLNKVRKAFIYLDLPDITFEAVFSLWANVLTLDIRLEDLDVGQNSLAEDGEPKEGSGRLDDHLD